jgi:hypothetical protein
MRLRYADAATHGDAEASGVASQVESKTVSRTGSVLKTSREGVRDRAQRVGANDGRHLPAVREEGWRVS